jgi:hypothetical protein
MPALLRTLHVVSLGLWFGAVCFFTFAGVLILTAFQDVSRLEGPARPPWFPLPQVYEGPRPSPAFPEPLRLEQGSRAFGVAVGSLFTYYFGLQTACAVVALLTALGLRHTSGLRVLRVSVLGLGVLSVLAGWGIERWVDSLRVTRNEATDAALANPTPDTVQAADRARSAFGAAHGVSLLVNFLTLFLALGGLALAAHLPAPQPAPAIPEPVPVS